MAIKVKGLKKLENYINEIPNRTMIGIEKSMTLIYNTSQPLVPVDTGALKRSGKIVKLPNGYNLIYHSENPINKYNYAPIQHENLTFKHKVGQAKYLENAVTINLTKIKDIIAKEVVK